MSRATADAFVAVEWPALQTRQAAALTAAGKYAQELAKTEPDGTVWEVHEYVGPAGKGYCLRLRAFEAGSKTYIRTLHGGPETWREHAWIQVQTSPAQ